MRRRNKKGRLLLGDGGGGARRRRPAFGWQFNYKGRDKSSSTALNDFKREIEALSSLLVAFFPSEREKIEEAKGKAKDSEAFLRLLARKSTIMRAFIRRQLREAKGVE